jgi:hypothetical protein
VLGKIISYKEMIHKQNPGLLLAGRYPEGSKHWRIDRLDGTHEKGVKF